MKLPYWKTVATALACFVASARSQTGGLTDLNTLLAGQRNLTTFYALIQKYPQILLQLPSSSGVTILAPSNEAFDKIPFSELNEAFRSNNEDTITNVLKYHILQGTRIVDQLVAGTPVFIPTLLTSPNYTLVSGGQRVENVKQAGDVVVFVSGQGSRSTLTQKDLLFAGGVVQVIDSLLIPPSTLTKTLNAFNLTSYQGSLYAADRNATYQTTPNVTVFVPNNAAFQALGPAITSMTSTQLTTVLDYMLIPQLIYSTGLTNGTKLTTAQGSAITVLQVGNNKYINSAQVLTSDILIANGVVHVIDNVLNPQAPSAIPNPTNPNQAPVFASASAVANLPFTSAIPCSTNCPAPSSTGSSSSRSVSGASASSTRLTTSSSKAIAAPIARQTGFRAAGLIAVLGGAVMMV